jgi:hypothetical protein
MSHLRKLALLLIGTWAGSASGQAVQLPTLHQFSASTTVVVPDRGSVALGGVNRAASGGSQFGGLPGNRSFGTAASASGMSVSVQIHDFEAMDRALLERAKAGRVSNPSRAAEVRASNRFNLRAGREENPSYSVAEIRRRKSATQPVADDVTQLLDRAARAEASGNPGAARVYLQMAIRKSSGAARARALEKLKEL